MNAQQLRNSILQEAIEGRLVPQDPNERKESSKRKTSKKNPSPRMKNRLRFQIVGSGVNLAGLVIGGLVQHLPKAIQNITIMEPYLGLEREN